MLNANQNKVHIMYLPLLEVLNNVGPTLGLNSFGDVVPWALLSDKAKDERHMRLLPFATILGIILDAIYGICEPPNTRVATS